MCGHTENRYGKYIDNRYLTLLILNEILILEIVSIYTQVNKCSSIVHQRQKIEIVIFKSTDCFDI